MANRQEKISNTYIQMKEAVIADGYATEIDWQNDVCFSHITECNFLREAAWVVLSSGMRESVVRKKFPAISEAFYYWEDAIRIANNSEHCKLNALKVFCHHMKIGAIITITQRISLEGFDVFRMRVQNEGIDFIQSLPFMGPATSYHLAKNIGLDVVKPDRHLLRLAANSGYESPRLLCEDISEFVGDRLSVIDIVLWRFATLNPDYLEYFTEKLD